MSSQSNALCPSEVLSLKILTLPGCAITTTHLSEDLGYDFRRGLRLVMIIIRFVGSGFLAQLTFVASGTEN